MKKRFGKHKIGRIIGLLGLYGRNFGAMAMGSCSVIILNMVTPLEFFKVQRHHFIFEHGKLHFMAYTLCLSILGIFFQYMAQRPISDVIKRLKTGEKIDEGTWERGRRRLLNLPFAIAIVDLATWLIIPAIIIHVAIYTSGQEYKGVLFVYFRTFMIGMISSTLAFFLFEDYIRRKLIPLFFPKGRLAELSRTFKLPVRKRIRILYMSGTSVPMFILVGSIFLSIWNLEENTVSAVA